MTQMFTKKWMCLMALTAVCMACAQKTDNQETEIEVRTQNYVPQGDSTTYGLACDGSTDSTLVFLPDAGGDPVVLDISEAWRNGNYFGHPEVGDKMAVLLNPDNPSEVLVAINMEQLCGTWTYQVLPEQRRLHSAEDEERIAATFSAEEKLRFDSLLSTLMVPREYGYTFKRDHTALAVGGPPRKTSLDEDLPVVYPPLRRYTEWHVFNGRLVFTYGGYSRKSADTLQNVKLINDTARLVILRRDTMAIQFADRLQGFRLTPDSIKKDN